MKDVTGNGAPPPDVLREHHPLSPEKQAGVAWAMGVSASPPSRAVEAEATGPAAGKFEDVGEVAIIHVSGVAGTWIQTGALMTRPPRGDEAALLRVRCWALRW